MTFSNELHGRAGAGAPYGRVARGPDRTPPRWWTLRLPGLLTLPAAAGSVVVAVVSNLCLKACETSRGLGTPIAAAEFLLAMAATVLLIAGLAVPGWRHGLRRTLWITCGLACLGGVTCSPGPAPTRD